MIIGVDFDGTVVTHDYPRVGQDIGAVPVLKRLAKSGNKLILFTMRSTKNGTLQDAENWFKQNGIKLYGVNTNPTQKEWTDSPKAHCNLYIDDAAFGAPLKFDGSKSPRPFIDWEKAEKMLDYYGAFDDEANDEEEDADDNGQDDDGTVKINESDIRKMVKESVKKILK